MKKKFYIILLLLVLIVPFTYCKYTESFTSHVTLSVRNPNYDVIFHSNNGTDDTNVQHFVYGTSDNLTLNTFTNGIYSFDGWTTNSDGSGTIYDDGALVSNLSGIDGDEFNLFAKWGVSVYTVTYTGVSSDELPTSVNDGDDLVVILPSTVYEIVSINVNGVNTTNYTYINGVIIVNNVDGNVIISVDNTREYEFIVNPGDSEIFSGTITSNTPVSFADIDGREFFAFNNTENVIDSLNITLNGAGTSGNAQTLDIALWILDYNTSEFVNTGQKVSLSYKKNENITSGTINYNINPSTTFKFVITVTNGNNKNIKHDKFSIVPHYANN